MPLQRDSHESVAARLYGEVSRLKVENETLKYHKTILLEACHAAVEYDKAIRSCSNDPEKMASFCTFQGQDLDDLYLAWMDSARKAIYEIEENKDAATT